MYKLRHQGARWRIVYGSYDGVEHFAVNELQRDGPASRPLRR